MAASSASVGSRGRPVTGSMNIFIAAAPDVLDCPGGASATAGMLGGLIVSAGGGGVVCAATGTAGLSAGGDVWGSEAEHADSRALPSIRAAQAVIRVHEF